MLKKLFNWIFADKLKELDEQIKEAKRVMAISDRHIKEVRTLLSGIDVSVDVHQHSRSSSWAAICLQGKRSDYIKFIDLGDSDIHDIANFLRRYERSRNIKVDCAPNVRGFLKFTK